MTFTSSLASVALPAGAFQVRDFNGRKYQTTAQTLPSGSSPTLTVVDTGSSGSPANGWTKYVQEPLILGTNGVPLANFDNITTVLPP